MDNKQSKKLNAEELEKRVAPGALYLDETEGGGEEEAPVNPQAPGRDAKV